MYWKRLYHFLVFASVACVCLLCICTPWDWLSGFSMNWLATGFYVSAASLLIASIVLCRIAVKVDPRSRRARLALGVAVCEFAKMAFATEMWSTRVACGSIMFEAGCDKHKFEVSEWILCFAILTSFCSTLLVSHVLMRRARALGRTIGCKRTVVILQRMWQVMAFTGFGPLVQFMRRFIPHGSPWERKLYQIGASVGTALNLLKLLLWVGTAPIFLAAFRSLRLKPRTQSMPELEQECQHFRSLLQKQLLALATSTVIMLVAILGIASIAREPAEPAPHLVYSLCMALDSASQVVLVSVLLGIFRSDTKQDSAARAAASERRERNRKFSSAYTKCADERWQHVVEDLAHRGFSLQSLLAFYKTLPQIMPHFDPNVHTTNDVVRLAIIPDSASKACAYAEKMNDGIPTRPKRLVTHNWSNLFRDLVAAIIAEALQQPTFDLIAYLLVTDMPALEMALDKRALSMTYWVCAFSVNQHRSICGSNPGRRTDPKTGLEHPYCSCGSDVYSNDTPPLRTSDKKGIMCQMNKFDDVIAYLSATDSSFSHVIAVDRRFELFNRAWCVAELATSDSIGMQQHMKLVSREALDSNTKFLQHLDVSKMQAARAEDVIEILAKIPDVPAFNARLQELLFGEHGLFGLWTTSDVFEQAAALGRVALFADACRQWTLTKNDIEAEPPIP